MGVTTHGCTGTLLHKRWVSMNARCRKEGYEVSKRYIERGITVCDEWRRSFVAFKDWALANGYGKSLEIDRIDNDKGYSPENCRWVTRKENMRNRSNTILIEFGGKIVSMDELAEITGILQATLRTRYHRGEIGERLTKPVRQKRRIK